MNPVDPRIPRQYLPSGSQALVIAEHQEEYEDLPAIRTPGHMVITRWTMSNEERAAIVRGADVFITVLSSGPVRPMMPSIGPIDWRPMEERNEDAEEQQQS